MDLGFRFLFNGSRFFLENQLLMANSKKASKTALMAAIHRFLATKEEHSEFKGQDHLATIFLPGKVKFFLSFKFIRESVKKKMRRLVPGTYEYVTARTKFFDEQFMLSVGQDCPQIVVLGAGYDSRAMRYQSSIENTKIFELDEASIQEQKKKLLQKAAIDLPDGLNFVPIDFNIDDIGGALKTAGFDFSKKTMFLWEGVSMYLEEKAVSDMLKIVAEKTGPGSRIVFDYFDKAILNGNSDAYGAKEITAEVKKSSEPFRFGIDPDVVGQFLEKHKLMLKEHYSPKDLEDKYITNEKNLLLGHVYGFGYQVVAESPG